MPFLHSLPRASARGVIVGNIEPAWTWIDALYWSTVATTTVGYGDIALTQEATRVFCVFWLLVGVTIVSAGIGSLGALAFEVQKQRKAFELSELKLTPEFLMDMDSDGNGINQLEFVLGCLISYDIVTKEEVIPILKKFNELDVDGSGMVTAEDWKMLTQQNYQESAQNEGKLSVRSDSREDDFLGLKEAGSSKGSNDSGKRVLGIGAGGPVATDETRASSDTNGAGGVTGREVD